MKDEVKQARARSRCPTSPWTSCTTWYQERAENIKKSAAKLSTCQICKECFIKLLIVVINVLILQYAMGASPPPLSSPESHSAVLLQQGLGMVCPIFSSLSKKRWFWHGQFSVHCSAMSESRNVISCTEFVWIGNWGSSYYTFWGPPLKNWQNSFLNLAIF